jgi:hypothetical protein
MFLLTARLKGDDGRKKAQEAQSEVLVLCLLCLLAAILSGCCGGDRRAILTAANFDSRWRRHTEF